MKDQRPEDPNNGLSFQEYEQQTPVPATPVPSQRSKQVPEQTISDECKYCAEGEPEWSTDASCWIHRRPQLDKRCTRKTLSPIGELPAPSQPAGAREFEQHTKAVSEFLNELYATMVDPCEQPQMTVAEMCGLLIRTAREHREIANNYAQQTAAELKAATRRIAELEEFWRDKNEQWKAAERERDSLREAMKPISNTVAYLRKAYSAGADAEVVHAITDLQRYCTTVDAALKAGKDGQK